MKRLVLRILLISYLVMPFSCREEVCDDSCCGETFEQTYYNTTIDSLKLVTGRLETYVYSGGEEYYFESTISNSYIDAALNIKVTRPDVSYEIQRNKTPFSFITSSYACSPPPAVGTPTQMLKNIEISSDSTIIFKDKVYKSGSDLKGLFVIAKANSLQVDVPIDRYIDSLANNNIAYGYNGQMLILKLKEYVVFPQNTLTVNVELDDESKFSMSTNEFMIE